jgi:hypothetical protein
MLAHMSKPHSTLRNKSLYTIDHIKGSKAYTHKEKVIGLTYGDYTLLYLAEPKAL